MSHELHELQQDANAVFDDAYAKIRHVAPRRKRVYHEAWTTDYAENTDIGLRKDRVLGSFARIVFVMGIGLDINSQLTVSLDPPVDDEYFRHLEKRPDSAHFYPTQQLSQLAVAEHFCVLLDRSYVTLLM